MPTHILVESLAHYEFARSSGVISSETFWYSSSPAVIEKLQVLNENVIWLDRLNQPYVSDAVGEMALEVTDRLAKAIRDFAMEVRWPHLEVLVGMQAFRLLSVLIYKQATLRSWIDATRGRRIIVGETALQFRPHVGLSIGVFDTIYAALWALHPSGDAELLEVPAVDLSPLASEFDKPSFLTRIISLLDFSSAQVSYRIWKYVLRGNWPAFRKGPSIFLLNANNESIREMLPHFAKAGCGIQKIATVGDVKPGGPIRQLPDASEISRVIELSARRRGLESPWGTVAEIVAMRLQETSRYWRPWIDHARGEARWIGHPSKPPVILSSAFKSYGDSALCAVAQERGIPTVVAEHGVSAGLSQYHVPCIPYSEVLSGSDYLVSAKAAKDIFSEAAIRAGVKQEVIGAPEQVRRIPNRRFQGWLTRMSLRARKERVVIYVAGTIQNNMKFQPHNLEDHETHALHRAMADRVMPRVRGVPVIKLYSTRRYRDADPMAGEFSAPHPVRTIKDGDFRYLRAGADIIILDSPLSTLGWVMGSDRPVYYLAHPSMPLLPDAQAAMEDALFFFDLADADWTERLVASLNRPAEVIAADWHAKAAARESFLQNYVFGPENAGRNGKDAVIMAAQPIPPDERMHASRRMMPPRASVGRS